MRTAWREVTLLCVACSLLVACDTNDGATKQASAPASAESLVASEPTTEPSAVDEAADQDVALDALLNISDFESGWTESPDSTSTSALAIKRKIAECAGSDQDSAVAFGGALAETGDFESPDDQQVVQQLVSVAPTASAAAERMAAVAAPEFIACIQPLYEQAIADMFAGTAATADRVTIEALDVTEARDRTVALRIAITIDVDGVIRDLFLDVVMVQSGRVISSLTFQSEDAPFATSDRDKYVALAASRLPTP